MTAGIKRSLTAIIIISLALTLSGCSLTAGITRRIRSNAALKAVRKSPEFNEAKLRSILAQFPSRVGTVNVSIPKGTQGATISGTLETRVTPMGPDWLVDFIASWNAVDFRRPGDPQTGRLDHTWEFIVTDKGRITAQRELGYFPPQYEK
ncbi:MAG TPA: hypothetical protein VGL40_03895 [Bacillota bacterium]